MTSSLVILWIGIACMAAAVALVLWPRFVAAIPAYAGLCLMHASTFTMFPTRTFIFYGIATAIVAALWWLAPRPKRDMAHLYMALGTLAGCLLGMLINARVMMLGTVIGAVVGSLAYARTPYGKDKFSKQHFFHYLCSDALPTIVAVAMAGVAVEGFIY